MAKVNETTLRIRAQNLAKKELRGVAKDLDEIAEGQKQNATNAGLAARAVRDLAEEQRFLNKAADELRRRGGVVGAVGPTKQKINEAAEAVRVLKERIDTLTAARGTGRGNAVAHITTAIKEAKGQLAEANREFDRQTSKLTKLGAQAEKFGASLDSAEQDAAEIATQLVRVERLQEQATDAAQRHAEAVKRVHQELRQARIEQGRMVRLKAVTGLDNLDGARRGQLAALRRQIEQDNGSIAQQAARQAAEQERIRLRLAEERIAEEKAAAKAAEDAARTMLKLEQQRLAARQKELNQAFRPGAPVFARNPVLGPQNDPTGAARVLAINERARIVEERLNQQRQQSVGVLGRLRGALGGVTAAINAQNNSLDRHHNLQGLFSDTGRKSLSVYQRLRGEILSLTASYVGLFQAINVASGAVRVTLQREALNMQLLVANNNDEVRTANDLKFIREEADRLGLVFDDLAKSYAGFKISARSAGLTQNQVNTTFSKAASIVTGLRLSAADADGVFRAFVQIMGKNKVQAEELTQQLGDRLPGAVAEFGKAMVAVGRIKSVPELFKEMEKGRIGVQEFLQFIDQYEKRTAGAVVAGSKSLGAELNRLKTAWNDFLASIGDGEFSDELKKVAGQLATLLASEKGAKFGEAISSALVGIGKAVIYVIEHLDTFLLLFKGAAWLFAIKAVVGLGAAILTLGGQAKATLLFLGRFIAGMVGARTATGLLAVAQRGLAGLLGGPVGIALIAAAGLYYKLGAAARSAEADTRALVATTKNLMRARGADAVAAAQSGAAELQERAAKIKDTERRLAARKAGLRSGRVSGLAEFDAKVLDRVQERSLNDTAKSVEGLTLSLQRQRSEFDSLNSSVNYAIRNARAYADAQQKIAKEDAAEQPNIPVLPGSEDKEKKGPGAKELENLAEKRRDIADRAAREVLDIEKRIADARQSLNAQTDDQIAANTALKMEEIRLDIEKQRNELSGLLRDATNAGSAEGVRNAQAALDKLPALEAALQKKAKEEALTAQIESREKKINELIAERDARIAAVNARVELGLESEISGRREAQRIQGEYTDRIIQAVDELIAKLRSPEYQNLFAALGGEAFIAQLQRMRIEAQNVDNTLKKMRENLAGKFAQGVANFFGTFIRGAMGGIEGINGIADALKNAGTAFLDFIAEFITGMAQAVLQAVILEAILAALEKRSPDFGGAARGAIKGYTGHTGGVVGARGVGHGNFSKTVSPLVFAGAPRFHEGGFPGLTSREVPAILERGEEVLTRDDPRNALNGGATQAPMDVSIYNNIDSTSVVSQGLESRDGKRAVVNVIQAHRAEIKRILA